MNRDTARVSVVVGALLGASCTQVIPDLPFESGSMSTDRCEFVDEGYGPDGDVEVRTQTVVSGLDTPWSLAFLPQGDILVTEREGRIRLVSDGELVAEPLASLEIADTNEGGLLGLALHPDFAENRLFYVYVTRERPGNPENRVERWSLADDARSAALDAVILEGIPASANHDGGRMRFGADGMLYVTTGDAQEPTSAQDPSSLAGKVLRMTDEGGVPEDNPFEGSLVYALGVRNSQGFDFFPDGTLALTDHGPSGELLRTGGDEVNVVSAGDNLGWPDAFQCEDEEGLVPPVLAFDEALPPGGAAFYRGEAIPEWRDALIVSALGARQLQLVRFDEDTRLLQSHSVYLRGALGRLREVIMGPDGELYVTTSNCDGRGRCPPEGDLIVRVTR